MRSDGFWKTSAAVLPSSGRRAGIGPRLSSQRVVEQRQDVVGRRGRRRRGSGRAGRACVGRRGLRRARRNRRHGREYTVASARAPAVWSDGARRAAGRGWRAILGAEVAGARSVGSGVACGACARHASAFPGAGWNRAGGGVRAASAVGCAPGGRLGLRRGVLQVARLGGGRRHGDQTGARRRRVGRDAAQHGRPLGELWRAERRRRERAGGRCV